MRPRRATSSLVALLLGAAGLLAACSSEDGDNGDGAASTSTSATTATSAAPATTAAPSTTAATTTSTTTGPTITVQDFTFQPATVPPGATVRLLNGDSTDHTVESREHLWTFDATTQTFSAPAAPGSYAVYCGVHSSMSGTLTVA
jgi:plastocyanin